MKMKWMLMVACVAGFAGGVAAETVYQTQNAGYGVDWTSATLWSDDQAPSAENDYVSENYLLRVHGGTNVLFAGRSLLLKSDINSGLGFKTSGMVVTVTNLVVDGARLAVFSEGHMTLKGDLAVDEGGLFLYTVEDLDRTLTIASLVTGDGPIYFGLPGFVSVTGGATFSNPDNTWRGDLAFLGDGPVAFANDLIGDSLVFGDAEGALGTLDLNGRAITFDDLTIGGDVYAAGVYTSTNLSARLQGEGTLTILDTPGQEITLTSLDENGTLSWNSDAAGEWSYTVEWASTPEGPWTNTWDHLSAIISTQTFHEVNVPRFYRVKGVAVEAH